MIFFDRTIKSEDQEGSKDDLRWCLRIGKGSNDTYLLKSKVPSTGNFRGRSGSEGRVMIDEEMIE